MEKHYLQILQYQINQSFYWTGDSDLKIIQNNLFKELLLYYK